MRTASMLLALVVVLGAAREAGADLNPPVRDYSIRIGQYHFGFVDFSDEDVNFLRGHPRRNPTFFALGPLGLYNVPFTATQGLVGFIVIVAVLAIASIAAVVGWKRKRVSA